MSYSEIGPGSEDQNLNQQDETGEWGSDSERKPIFNPEQFY